MYSTPGRPQGTLPCAPQGCSCIAPRFLPGGSELTPDSTAMISVPHGQASPPGVPDTADTIVYDRPAPAPAPSQYPRGPSPSVSGVLMLLPKKNKAATGGNPPLPWREATPTAAATPRAATGHPAWTKQPPRTHPGESSVRGGTPKNKTYYILKADFGEAMGNE